MHAKGQGRRKFRPSYRFVRVVFFLAAFFFLPPFFFLAAFFFLPPFVFSPYRVSFSCSIVW